MDEGTELALRGVRGDKAALAAWIELCYRPVWRYCATMIRAELADELAQDTFERALRALPSFRAGSSVTSWLIGIARHACMDRLRVEYRSDRFYQRIAAVSQRGHHSGDATERIALLDMIGRLETERREAFVLTQLLGFTYAETATVCACPVGTVRSRVARARTELLAEADNAEQAAPPRTTSSH